MLRKRVRSSTVSSLGLVALALTASLTYTSTARAQSAPAGIRLERILEGGEVGRITGLVFSDDGTGRMFLVQQSGEIRVVLDGQLQPELFLDLSRKVTCCDNERGLLGLAFHPDFETNGYAFVVYSDKQSRTVVSRFSVSENSGALDRSSERIIIRWDQPEPPHNGGAIAFGPDGYLYLGAGDGGTRDAAADLESLLGSILRLDVDGAFPYSIPPDNPFVADPEALDEIWVSGLRNPWRFTIDRQTGDLYIGDVGAAQYEEVNYQPAGSGGGENFGWPVKEGPRCVAGDDFPACGDERLVDPIVSYRHKEGTCNAVTGGYRYRGPKVPTLPGLYVFGDFCRGDIWGLRRNAAGNWVVNELLQSGLLITTFAEDPQGNLYLAHFRGDIYRVVGQSLFASDFESGGLLDWSQRRGGVEAAAPGLRRSGHALDIRLGERKAFVRSKHPSAETTFSVGFDLNLGGAVLTAEPVEILRLAGAQKRGHIKLTLERAGGTTWLNLLARGDAGGFYRVGRTVVPRSRTVRIELDWLAASAPGANDGQISLSKNGTERIAATDLDTDRKKVSAVTIGSPSATGGSGGVLIDNYASTP